MLKKTTTKSCDEKQKASKGSLVFHEMEQVSIAGNNYQVTASYSCNSLFKHIIIEQISLINQLFLKLQRVKVSTSFQNNS